LPVEIPPVIPMTGMIRNINILYVQQTGMLPVRRDDGCRSTEESPGTDEQATLGFCHSSFGFRHFNDTFSDL
jgi:hypothetical protein